MYFDEANIEQMSKIIALKELGLELNEINNLDSKLVHNKIEEYEEKVKKLIDNIHTLKTLSIENGGVRNLKSFINDELAIGKWALKEMYDNISDYPNNPIDFDLGIKELNAKRRRILGCFLDKGKYLYFGSC